MAYTAAGAAMPPTAAAMGSAALRGSRSCPVTNSRLSSSPTTKKKMARMPSLAQRAIGMSSMPRNGIGRLKFFTAVYDGSSGEFAKINASSAASNSSAPPTLREPSRSFSENVSSGGRFRSTAMRYMVRRRKILGKR